MTTAISSTRIAAELGQDVQVVYFGHEDTFAFAGQTVLTAKTAVQGLFGVPYFAEARINGEHCSTGRILQPGDRLSFRKRFGFKRSDDEPLYEVEAEALIRSYSGLLKIAREVKAMRLTGADSVDATVRKVAEWCHAEFGPVVEPMKATFDSLVKRIQTLEDEAEAGDADGPTDFGQLWFEGECYELKLTTLERLLIRALWSRNHVPTDKVCEAVYGDDEEREESIKGVKKRVNKKLVKCCLKVVSREEQMRLTDITPDSDDQPTT